MSFVHQVVFPLIFLWKIWIRLRKIKSVCLLNKNLDRCLLWNEYFEFGGKNIELKGVYDQISCYNVNCVYFNIFSWNPKIFYDEDESYVLCGTEKWQNILCPFAHLVILYFCDKKLLILRFVVCFISSAP
jgi:hypothetical protein